MEKFNEYYDKFLMKKYNHWSLYIHENQFYLGRCYLWCDRLDALDLTFTQPQEWQDLKQALIDTRIALNLTFNPDLLNYAFLSNEAKHLHGHIIPRYKEKREFAGMVFEDKLFGKNYKNDRSFVTPKDVLLEIQQEIMGNLGKYY